MSRLPARCPSRSAPISQATTGRAAGIIEAINVLVAWYITVDEQPISIQSNTDPIVPIMPVSLGVWPRFQYFNQLEGRQEKRNRTVQVRAPFKQLFRPALTCFLLHRAVQVCLIAPRGIASDVLISFLW